MSLASEEIVRGCGLTFSISPVKPKPKSRGQVDYEDNNSVLTLAPFTAAPKINFSQVKVDSQVERNFLIVNPQEYDIDLKVSNHDLNIKDMIIKIEKRTHIEFRLKWQPDTPGDFKFTIFFEVTNRAHLKFVVYAFGVCLKPAVAPKLRKPLIIQPFEKNSNLKHMSSTLTSLKPSASNKENNDGAKIQPEAAKASNTISSTSQKFGVKPLRDLPSPTNTVITTLSYNTSQQQTASVFKSKDFVDTKHECPKYFHKTDNEDENRDNTGEKNYG